MNNYFFGFDWYDNKFIRLVDWFQFRDSELAGVGALHPGRSCSVAVVAAFLMQKEKISLGKAKSLGFGADFMGLYQESWDLTV